LWASGRYDLGLTEDEFWNLTLKEFNALLVRFKDAQDWQNYRAAMICAVVANTVRSSKKKARAWTPSDFMPIRERKVMTDKQMFAQVQANNALLGGKVEEV
jgi:hypothetical protein